MIKYYQDYFKRYPHSSSQDFVKFLYQAYLGGGHLIVSEDSNYQYLLKEYLEVEYDENHILYEDISDDLVRVHLEALKEDELKLYHRLFMLSSSYSLTKQDFINAIENVKEMIKKGELPLSYDEYCSYLKEYQKEDYPLVRHTPIFRDMYHPHYRLMKKQYIPLIDLLKKVNALDKHSVILIEGHAGAGKSTLANILNDVFHYPIVHTDDFFLQPNQRTQERLCEVGGNLDYERFYNEVVKPINNKESFDYQIFDCMSMSLTDYAHICFDSSIIVEGSYSMHPYFKDYATFKIFLDIDNQTQIERIRNRNGEFLTQKFINEWIPKENAYFDYFNIKDNADYIIETTKAILG